VLEHALTVLKFENILAIVLPTNTRSVKLLERLGFVLMGNVELYGHMNCLYRYCR